MKTIPQILTLSLLLFVISGATAQCPNQAAVVYDTTVNGTGNDYYNFTFPKFDPAKGTLTDVKVDATVTLLYDFQLENNGLGAVNNYRVRLTRDDEVSSTALLTPLTHMQQQSYGPFALAGTNGIPGIGGDFLSRGPLYAMNQQQISHTVYNTADFMGLGGVSFYYASTSFASLIGSASVSYTGNVQDEMKFKLTYHYCPVTLLATDITSFTANKSTDGTVDIKWITQNEKTNRTYALQKSTDGRVFRDIVEFAAKASPSETGSYRYSYQIQPNDNNKTILFKIKLVDKESSPKYSAARAVKLTSGENKEPVLYPNPAKGATTLLFSNQKRGNWDVEIMTISGQVIKRCQFNNALLAKLNAANELKAGLYMIRSTNKTTQEQFVQRLLVQ